MSRKSSPATRTQQAAGVGAGLIFVLLIPRLIRVLYPEVWIEDDFYLENAYLVSIGMRPYLDFVHVHLPVLEWIAGGYLWVFGASITSLELLNESAIFVTSLLVFFLARRIEGRPVAIASAILYGFASLVFRYHVYERECFVAPLVMGAAWFAIDDESSPLPIAALLALACAIKLTAFVPVFVIVSYLFVLRRRPMRATVVAASVVVAMALLSAICYRLYGFEFIFQTFLFHFMKGRDTTAALVLYPSMILDILAPLFVLGMIRVLNASSGRSPISLVLTMAVAEYVFFGWLSPTTWGHNYLEVLPFIAIIAGIGAIAFASAVRYLIVSESAGRVDWLWAIGGGGLIMACLIVITPLVNENWLRDSVYGFGFMPREEISQISAAVRHVTQPGDEIVAPSFICFAANRPELIRYPELYGAYREAMIEYHRDGFLAARRRLGGSNFFNLIGDTAHFWTDPINDAVTGRKVKVVISDSLIQLLPLVLVQPQKLADNGYHPIFRTEHYTVWALASDAHTQIAPLP